MASKADQSLLSLSPGKVEVESMPSPSLPPPSRSEPTPSPTSAQTLLGMSANQTAPSHEAATPHRAITPSPTYVRRSSSSYVFLLVPLTRTTRRLHVSHISRVTCRSELFAANLFLCQQIWRFLSMRAKRLFLGWRVQRDNSQGGPARFCRVSRIIESNR